MQANKIDGSNPVKMQRTEIEKDGTNMAYLEVSKNYINRFYNGNKNDAVSRMDGVIFDDEKVSRTFSDGWDGFFRYKEDNKKYCYFVKL